MAPRQVFPYDECGGLRTSRQLMVESQHQQQEPSKRWAANREIASSSPYTSPLEDSNNSWEQPSGQQYGSDLHDALNDDDDDESVDLGPNWPSREVVPKPGVEIFVGGLTRSTRRDMLRDWFQHAGEVTEVRIARDKRRRRCRGYGYVRFATSEQANLAIDTMHRFEFKRGRFLGVLPSDENRTLFVGGLREEWSCSFICQLLKEKMPGLTKVEPIPDREDRFKIRTFCFLEFASHAEAAVIYNRHHINPKTPPPPHQQAAASPAAPPGQASLELLLPSSAAAGVEEARTDGGDGGGVGGHFCEWDTRTASNSTASTGGIGECGGDGGLCSAATASTGYPSWSPVLDGGYGGGSKDGEQEAGTKAEGAVPLVVNRAVLKVDWADPLRYHIHLNGGIKGPSAPPEFGTADGRPPSRGTAPCAWENACNGGAVRGAGDLVPGPGWPQQQRQGRPQQPTPPLRVCDRRQQNGDHARAMDALKHQQTLHRRQQQPYRHFPEPCQRGATFSRLDVSPSRPASHLVHSDASAAASTLEHGYTISAPAALSSKSPFCDDVVSAGRARLSQEQSVRGCGDRPRSVTSNGVPPPGNHQSSHYAYRHRAASPGFLRTTAVAAGEQDCGSDVRINTASGLGDSQTHHPHRQAAVAPGYRPQHASGVLGGSGALPRGGGVQESSVQQLQHHRRPQHQDGVGERQASKQRPFSASPDAHDGGHRRLRVLSADTIGRVDGNYGNVRNDVPTRSTSCRPYGDHHLPFSGAPPSSSWDYRQSKAVCVSHGEGWDWGSPGREDSTVPSPSKLEERRRAFSSPNDDHGWSQQQRREHGDTHDCSTGGSAQAWPMDRLPLRPTAWDSGDALGPHDNSGGGLSSGAYSKRDAATFATFDRGFERQQQQGAPRRPERFSGANLSSSGAAPHPHARRHTVSEGLASYVNPAMSNGNNMVGGRGGVKAGIITAENNKNDGMNPPPGFSARITRAFSGSSAGQASARWTDTPSSDASGTSPQQQREKRSADGVDVSASAHGHGHGHSGGTWGASPPLPEGGAPTFTTIIGSGLWDNVGTEGLNYREQSSWQDALLPCERADHSPWGS